jgi:hypothetical protein
MSEADLQSSPTPFDASLNEALGAATTSGCGRRLALAAPHQP